MAKFRALPHWAASEISVTWGDWQRIDGGSITPVPTLIEGWDYDQALDLALRVSIDANAFLESTGLESLGNVEVIATADCPSTQQRFISRVPATELLVQPDPIASLHLPASAIANELLLRGHLALNREEPPTRTDPVAHHAGSRLAGSPIRKIYLEGSASRFPTEAVSFSQVNWEASAWSVRVRFSDLRESFAGSVRLMLNADHPVGSALAAMDPTTYAAVGSFLRIDIVRSLIAAVASHLEETGLDHVPDDEESVGLAVSQLASQYLGKDFASIAELRRGDVERYERMLQQAVGVQIGEPV